MPSIIYALIVSVAILSGRFFLSAKNYTSKKLLFPTLTIAIIVILILCYIFQNFFPQLQFLFERNGPLILKGQIWRLATSLFFQDGGISGAFFNILTLLFIGGISEQFTSKRMFLIIFFLGAVLTNMVALFLQPIGAGNSIANFSLVGFLFFVTIKNSKNTVVRSFDILGLLLSLVLLFSKDIHGVAIFIGIILYFLVSKRKNKTSFTFQNKKR